MSFNIKRNYFVGGPKCFHKRKEVIQEVVRRYDPDIIGTQELTASSLSILKKLLSQYSYVGKGRGGDDKGEYTAIFYRKDKFDLHEDYTFWLSKTPYKPSRSWFAAMPRICTTCALVFKDDPTKMIRLYNTHLDHISYFARVKGLELITRRVNADIGKRTPTLLMGDFNAKPTSKTMKKWQKQSDDYQTIKLKNAYTLLDEDGMTRSYHGFVGKTKGSPIDYIFTTEDIEIQEVHICRDQINGFFPSDHYPIVATLQIQ